MIENQKQKISSILKKYNLTHFFFEEDDLQIGGGNNLSLYKRYYFYIPVSIGLAIVIIALILNIFPFSFFGTPFLVYSFYGLYQVHLVKKDNRTPLIIKDGEIYFTNKKKQVKINTQNFKQILLEKVFLEDIHSVCFKIVDKENNSYVFLTLYSEDPNALYADCDFLKNFIQRKIKYEFE
jgi:hypothetical protein